MCATSKVRLDKKVVSTTLSLFTVYLTRSERKLSATWLKFYVLSCYKPVTSLILTTLPRLYRFTISITLYFNLLDQLYYEFELNLVKVFIPDNQGITTGICDIKEQFLVKSSVYLIVINKINCIN